MNKKTLILLLIITLAALIGIVDSQPSIASKCIAGTWPWDAQQGYTVEINEGGSMRVYNDATGATFDTGTWSYDPNTNSYTLQWSKGPIDTVSLSADCQHLKGYNNYGTAIISQKSSPEMCKIQVNGQGLDPQTSRFFGVAGIYSGKTDTMLRIVYSTDTGVSRMHSPSDWVIENSLFHIWTTQLPPNTKRVDYEIEYIDSAGNWISCGNNYNWHS